jgi:site-specific recombinase XerC
MIAWINSLSPRLGEVTVSRMVRCVRVFFKWLYRSDTYPEVVAWIKPKRVASLPSDTLSWEDVLKLARCASNARDRALIMVLYDSAARRSELLNLKIKDVLLDEYGAQVKLSGKTGERVVRLIDSVPDLLYWLEQHPARDNREAPLWMTFRDKNYSRPAGRGLNYSSLEGMLWRLRKRAGIRKRANPHSFRHSRLTELAKELTDTELKIFAGWSMTSDMPRIYVHLSGKDVGEKLLRNRGLIKGEEKEAGMKVRVCRQCAFVNSPASRLCMGCGANIEVSETMHVSRRKVAEALAQLPQKVVDSLMMELINRNKMLGDVCVASVEPEAAKCYRVVPARNP